MHSDSSKPRRHSPTPPVAMVCEQCGRSFLIHQTHLRHGHRRFCDQACQNASHGTPEQRFWAKVNKNGPVPEHCPELGPCWPWTAARAQGYGKFGAGGDRPSQFAHRYSWELLRGPIPPDTLVLHACDTPPCVNPDHLFLGTHADNARDKMAKGRGYSHPLGRKLKSFVSPNVGERHWSRLRPELIRRGTAVGSAKLTTEQVVAIRAELARGATQDALARKYGVSQVSISCIALGKTWRHLL